MDLGKMKLAVFISGRGSNMSALIEACRNNSYPAEIAVVLSNKVNAGGLAIARDHGIPTEIVPHKDYDTRAGFEDAISKALAHYPIDLICLAGFMRVLGADFVSQWDGRMINIHPSLLPKYKGLNTHKRALDNGDSQTGCTVHYVVPDVDSGEIILQRSIDIKPDDTPETLAARLLNVEHKAYVEGVRIVADMRQKTAT